MSLVLGVYGVAYNSMHELRDGVWLAVGLGVRVGFRV